MTWCAVPLVTSLQLNPGTVCKWRAQFIERRVNGLYLSPPENALVLCADEKSQCEAFERTQPMLPLGLGCVEGVTHDHVRHGTTTLFAALNVLNGAVLAECKPRHRHQGSLSFLRTIDKSVPTESDSCDVSRELYKDYSVLFASYWKRATGADVKVDPSHGGSSKQARTAVEGEEHHPLRERRHGRVDSACSDQAIGQAGRLRGRASRLSTSGDDGSDDLPFARASTDRSRRDRSLSGTRRTPRPARLARSDGASSRCQSSVRR